MNVSLEGYNERVATLVASSSVKEGDAVTISANNTVDKTGSGTAPCGVCLGVRDGYATVLFNGYCTVKFSGTAPTTGYVSVGGDGTGKLKVMTSGGRQVTIVSVDATNKVLSIIL